MDREDDSAYGALLGRIADALERLAPPVAGPPDWTAHIAWRWRRRPGGGGVLAPVTRPQLPRAADLLAVDAQKLALLRNTSRFLRGESANNALLWGARGTGKSSLIKAMLHELHADGLRMIEVEARELVDLPAIVELVVGRPERFIVYCDDLSFEADDASYKALKAALDGSLAAAPDNVLIYASSNRRHLLPEFMAENHEATVVDGELHASDATEEKVSLSERFGLWLSFRPFDQDQYLAVVDHWLRAFAPNGPDTSDEPTRIAALRWARQRGGRSGRVAQQFARDWRPEEEPGRFG